MKNKGWQLVKRPTGIAGLDEMTHGGLPRGQTTLVVGEMSAGKTVLGLQVLASAIAEGGSGIFISFEESPDQIRRNADSFDWGQALNESKDWSIVDARMPLDAEHSGDFGIEGLLAAIQSKASSFRDPWVVIDGVDQLLQRQSDRIRAIDQIRQLNECCERHDWTMLLSGKVGIDRVAPKFLEGIEFMLPTVLNLYATTIDGRLHRYIRVGKYRGSSHREGDMPMLITDKGIQIPAEIDTSSTSSGIVDERVGTGIPRLDELLDGGIYRGSSVLISGRPGTAKSTLAASFAEAAAKRDERALYISFDELQAPFVRNLASIDIHLQQHIDDDKFRFYARTSSTCVIARHLLEIEALIDEFEPHILVIDPVSALAKAGSPEAARNGVEQLLTYARMKGITSLVTSLTSDDDIEQESTTGMVSTIADTWIVLGYHMRGGERNRSLSIVKSRGSGHSNQQRELLLSDDGVNLEDIYEFGSDVLMGTAREQKDSEERREKAREELERAERRHELERRIDEARNQAERLSRELELEDRLVRVLEEESNRHARSIRRRRQPEARGEKTGDDK